METYSPSNAAAQDPEKRVRLINIQKIHYKINSLIQKLQKKKKIERTRRLTDLECPKSPAQSLHIPSTSHNNPRTSQSCRQNNNFRLIYSNVRNYCFQIPSHPTPPFLLDIGLAKRLLSAMLSGINHFTYITYPLVQGLLYASLPIVTIVFCVLALMSISV